ncbi:MAG: nucleoside triphosphate pyrophosphohydrolase [Gammaproteobacteria bacterium]|nr:nucleoside triphosphate pyrophosphohydrolase [Gammaproteobacteria bacterium]
MKNVDKLLKLMKALRDPETGCPWDIRQTSASIARYTLEETHETLDAIARGDTDNLREELGDLLFHIVFHACIAEENGDFDFDQVAAGIVEKMTRRHPHVFGERRGENLDEPAIMELWQEIKRAEKANAAPVSFATRGSKLSAIHRAEQLQRHASAQGFDWPDIAPVMDKLKEELLELEQAIAGGDKDAIEDELGDVMFVCVNIARHARINAEMALRSSNQKFVRRFEYVMAQMRESGQVMNQRQLEQMEQFWQASKAVVG